MEISVFLARVIGLYFVIISLFMLIRHKSAASMLKDFATQRGVLLLNAIITLIIGILLVVSHNLWVADWRVVITIIAWLVLIAGIVRLFTIDATKSIVKWWLKRSDRLIVAAIVYLIVGIYLLFVSMGAGI
ncbi:hypothetical protein [Coxiella burnetii]|uniref:Hypothetical membrane spanning protein n=3 Tax=Coxiella burnetii TaxID=777 RepID=Q83EV2_COXBU|nr:hypothetical protein [Coxiella burnetii]NP_819252.1 membrane-spanning protein [Coxiella burnetii RSA 493]AAO89766.1 hypothetical membrane spanning protein [Coxiella burnetii RSA 493]ABS76869.1 hypothetical membrane spanning protein [Coxiella burnetii Dugway 5J108-111]ABX78017.1 hypothetical protein COXBURSA331_A0299 [Coxiella burnetii RSA 331]ACJ19069.1 hypothetical membrane spanning protein [Coxiella burnetii CbuG_Q212]ACJ19685.1 hypothetical membrane spanning protein [Coxiella burnetii C